MKKIDWDWVYRKTSDGPLPILMFVMGMMFEDGWHLWKMCLVMIPLCFALLFLADYITGLIRRPLDRWIEKKRKVNDAADETVSTESTGT